LRSNAGSTPTSYSPLYGDGMSVRLHSTERVHQDAARYHSLDALRGVMMLLGIYLHAAVAYSAYGNWPWKDGSITGLFDVSLGLIHVFRMPVFYVLAGFFAALLYERRGARAFVRNRVIRILVPFAVGWAILFPLVKLLAIWARSVQGHTANPSGSLDPFTWREVLGRLDPMHLWFLEYLVFFYVFALVLVPLLRHRYLAVPVGVINRSFRAVTISPLGAFALAFLTCPILYLMREGAIDDPSGFAPEGRILIAYLVFFGWGWLLSRNADLLLVLRRFPHAPIFIGLGVVAALLGYSIWYWLQETGTQMVLGVVASAWCLALSMWLFVFGIVGIFFRVLERPVARFRYLSDSSYWLYLVHMPVLLVFQVAAAETNWPPALKAMVVLAASLATLLGSYHVFVRFTWVGAILNGRKYDIGRGVPERRSSWLAVPSLRCSRPRITPRRTGRPP
jgi:peptidoglycan/LPS O-acetylase OafA/YrhL